MGDLEALDVETSLERAVDSARDGMAVLDEDGTYLYLNQSHADLYGYDDPEALIGESWRRLYDDGEVERFETEILPAFEEAGEWRGEATGTRRDGSTFVQDLSLTRTEEGSVICVVRDVTERRERRQTLQRYETVVETIRDAVYTLDEDGRITWVNEVAVEEFDVGYTREELVGSYVSKVLDAEDIEKCLDIIQRLLTEDADSGRCEVDIQTAHGDEIPCDLHLALLPFEDGEFRGTVGVVRDITDRKRREQRLSVLHRVLRHNLRNDMNAILGQAALVADACDGVEENLRTIRETAREAVAVGDRARKIEESLRHSARERTAVDAVEVVTGVCDSAREAAPEVTITVDAPASCPVVANETLDIVVENLLENAIEHVENPDVTVSVDGADGGEWATIRVEDDGPGLPDEEIEVLGADEETPLRHGSGLGLWWVQWLVDSYGGQVSFGDPETAGGVVTVELQAAS